jgi:hypothetical protein
VRLMAMSPQAFTLADFERMAEWSTRNGGWLPSVRVLTKFHRNSAKSTHRHSSAIDEQTSSEHEKLGSASAHASCVTDGDIPHRQRGG